MSSTNKVTLELIEQYVLGQLDTALAAEVEAASVVDPQVRETITELRTDVELFARAHAKAPPPGVKERILARLAAIDMDRLDWPPVIHAGSKVADYTRWLDAPGMERPDDADDIFFIPFAENAQGISAIVWMVTGSPEETHIDQIEKFLVVEGACEIHMRGQAHPLAIGDVFSIPLHTPHSVKVTSGIPCKVVLQRIAA